MSASELLQAIEPILTSLQQLGAKHYLGGSVASSVYGVARTTLDADVIADLRIGHVAPLIADLAADYYISQPMILAAIASESSFNLIHLATMFKVDVFVAKSRAFDQSALARARMDTIGEDEPLNAFVASPEDVVLSKLEWYRIGGEVSERQWSDVLGVLKVQHAALDNSYLRQWANELGVLDLLNRAFGDARGQ